MCNVCAFLISCTLVKSIKYKVQGVCAHIYILHTHTSHTCAIMVHVNYSLRIHREVDLLMWSTDVKGFLLDGPSQSLPGWAPESHPPQARTPSGPTLGSKPHCNMQKAPFRTRRQWLQHAKQKTNKNHYQKALLIHKKA